MTEKISLQAPSNGVPQRKHRRYGKNKSITYLGLVANVIQDSPEKMLTFTQLMDRLEAFISGDRKGIENNIRVCLSSNDCFVKVPADPYVTYSKKNLWKFDESRITAKMARRNFKGILDHFPDLSTKVRKESRERKFEATDRTASLHSPTQELDCAPIQRKTEGKFTSSFSIDSILNTGSSRLCPQARQLSVVSRVPTDQVLLCAESGMGTKRGMSWDRPPVETCRAPCPGESYPSYVIPRQSYPVNGGRIAPNMMRMGSEPSYPVYIRPGVALCFSDRFSRCEVGYPVWATDNPAPYLLL